MIYFLQHREDNYIKIGTTANLKMRLAQLSERYGEHLLTLLGIMDGTRETEIRLHLQFAHLQRFREWFRPGEDLLAFIKENAQPFSVSQQRRNDATQAYEKQQLMRRLYYANPSGLSDSELAALLDISRMTAWRYRQQLHAVKVQPGRGLYTLIPSTDEITEAINLLKIAISSSRIDPHTIIHTISSL